MAQMTAVNIAIAAKLKFAAGGTPFNNGLQLLRTMLSANP